MAPNHFRNSEYPMVGLKTKIQVSDRTFQLTAVLIYERYPKVSLFNDAVGWCGYSE